jgi:hypothetical protein
LGKPGKITPLCLEDCGSRNKHLKFILRGLHCIYGQLKLLKILEMGSNYSEESFRKSVYKMKVLSLFFSK